ncbi:hypothetical protein EDC19_1034 [Natranaerovirga hydrolytica]|uniref:Peptidase M50-like protein n=1 Tax=Natranaerovirga hydrolytica TaxID=680378 RepID=A0A4R1N117_9FIRM|nr:hypothetical protein [Natranaerovirga hydrolytica]TCK98602.1 hypothetical protein EDC19_1034 [Natranaerovirga hydrolytica]
MEDKKKIVLKKLTDNINLLIGVVIGLILVQFDMFTSVINGVTLFQFILLLIIIPMLYFFHNIIHELGHLIVGLLQSFQFYSFRIGPLIWEKNNDTVVLRKQKQITLNVSTLMFPKANHHIERKQVLYYAGGIVSNLIIGIVFLGLYYVLSLENAYLLKGFLATGWIIGLFLFLSNLVPYKSEGFVSDGSNIVSLIRKSPKDIAEIKALYASAKISAGIPVKQMDAYILEEDSDLGDNEILGIIMNLYRYYHYVEKKNYTKAQKYIQLVENNIEFAPDTIKNQCYFEVLYAYSFFNLDKDKAKATYDRIENKLYQTHSITKFRVQMAYELYINEDLEMALTIGKKGLELKDEEMVKGEAIFSSNEINKMIKEIKKMSRSNKRKKQVK